MGRITDATRAKASDNAVIFACDDGHLPYALFAAHRIHRVEPDGNFDLVIAMPDISGVATRDRDSPVRFVQVDMSDLPDVPMVKAWISNATYFRWMLPQAFATEYGSLFYLDTDTYLRRPGLDAFFSGLDRPVGLGAVTDFQRFVTLDAAREAAVTAKLRDLGGHDGQYFNAGVLLMQPDAFLAMDGPARFVAAARENVQYLPIHRDQDQGAMNLAFANDIVPMNPLLNWCSRDWMNPPMVDRYDPVILHFAGRGKPWNLQDDPFIQSFADEYIGWLTEHFPEWQPKAALRSAAWRRENPRHRLKLFEDIRIALYHRRNTAKLKSIWHRHSEAKAAKMDAAIAQAVIG